MKVIWKKKFLGILRLFPSRREISTFLWPYLMILINAQLLGKLLQYYVLHLTGRYYGSSLNFDTYLHLIFNSKSPMIIKPQTNHAKDNLEEYEPLHIPPWPKNPIQKLTNSTNYLPKLEQQSFLPTRNPRIINEYS